jgi:hypothetical protein
MEAQELKSKIEELIQVINQLNDLSNVQDFILKELREKIRL